MTAYRQICKSQVFTCDMSHTGARQILYHTRSAKREFCDSNAVSGSALDFPNSWAYHVSLHMTSSGLVVILFHSH